MDDNAQILTVTPDEVQRSVDASREIVRAWAENGVPCLEAVVTGLMAADMSLYSVGVDAQGRLSIMTQILQVLIEIGPEASGEHAMAERDASGASIN